MRSLRTIPAALAAIVVLTSGGVALAANASNDSGTTPSHTAASKRTEAHRAPLEHSDRDATLHAQGAPDENAGETQHAEPTETMRDPHQRLTEALDALVKESVLSQDTATRVLEALEKAHAAHAAEREARHAADEPAPSAPTTDASGKPAHPRDHRGGMLREVLAELVKGEVITSDQAKAVADALRPHDAPAHDDARDGHPAWEMNGEPRADAQGGRHPGVPFQEMQHEDAQSPTQD